MAEPRYETAYELGQRLGRTDSVVCLDCGAFVMDVAAHNRFHSGVLARVWDGGYGHGRDGEADGQPAGERAPWVPVGTATIHRHPTSDGGWLEHDHMAGGVPHKHDKDAGFQACGPISGEDRPRDATAEARDHPGRVVTR